MVPRRERSRTPRSNPGPPSALRRNLLLLNQRGIGDVLFWGFDYYFLFLFFIVSPKGREADSG